MFFFVYFYWSWNNFMLFSLNGGKRWEKGKLKFFIACTISFSYNKHCIKWSRLGSDRMWILSALPLKVFRLYFNTFSQQLSWLKTFWLYHEAFSQHFSELMVFELYFEATSQCISWFMKNKTKYSSLLSCMYFQS